MENQISLVIPLTCLLKYYCNLLLALSNWTVEFSISISCALYLKSVTAYTAPGIAPHAKPTGRKKNTLQMLDRYKMSFKHTQIKFPPFTLSSFGKIHFYISKHLSIPCYIKLKGFDRSTKGCPSHD